ncbi:LysR substrate-binding domain-containing protein, partial [Burkholderia gladioli]|nr:LysR substrate-binding domain-containing protein [Burkholderia gladioli]
RVLHRSTHAMRPTEAGQLLYERARSLLAGMRGLQAELHKQRDEPGGLLRIDCPAPFGRLHLMPALAAFMRRHPAIVVELVLTDSMVDLPGDAARHRGGGHVVTPRDSGEALQFDDVDEQRQVRGEDRFHGKQPGLALHFSQSDDAPLRISASIAAA